MVQIKLCARECTHFSTHMQFNSTDEQNKKFELRSCAVSLISQLLVFNPSFKPNIHQSLTGIACLNQHHTSQKDEWENNQWSFTKSTMPYSPKMFVKSCKVIVVLKWDIFQRILNWKGNSSVIFQAQGQNMFSMISIDLFCQDGQMFHSFDQYFQVASLCIFSNGSRGAHACQPL